VTKTVFADCRHDSLKQRGLMIVGWGVYFYSCIDCISMDWKETTNDIVRSKEGERVKALRCQFWIGFMFARESAGHCREFHCILVMAQLASMKFGYIKCYILRRICLFIHSLSY